MRLRRGQLRVLAHQARQPQTLKAARGKGYKLKRNISKASSSAVER